MTEDKYQIIPAGPGYYAASVMLHRSSKEYTVYWHPVVAWMVFVETGLARPVVVSDQPEWCEDEVFGAVLSPFGHFLYDGCVETSLEGWLRVEIPDFDAWCEVEPKPLPVSTAAPVADDCGFDPKAFHPGMKGSATKRAGTTTATAASIFD